MRESVRPDFHPPERHQAGHRGHLRIGDGLAALEQLLGQIIGGDLRTIVGIQQHCLRAMHIGVLQQPLDNAPRARIALLSLRASRRARTSVRNSGLALGSVSAATTMSCCTGASTVVISPAVSCSAAPAPAPGQTYNRGLLP